MNPEEEFRKADKELSLVIVCHWVLCILSFLALLVFSLALTNFITGTNP
jgi:cytochrome bd-type quinol oxidase subunit 2